MQITARNLPLNHGEPQTDAVDITSFGIYAYLLRIFPHMYYHAMTFWNFSALSFISLDTKGYQPRTFSGSCLNCPIHILWCLFKWNLIWGSRGRKGYHLLKECHGMSRIGCDGSLPNSISDDTIGNRNQSANCFLSASCERSLNFLTWSHTQRQWFRTHA